MTFTDFQYYAVVLGLFVLLRLSHRLVWQHGCLAVFSFAIYYTVEPTFVWILMALSFFNYACGLWIERSLRPARGLWASVILNLGTLAVLKYSSFFMMNLQSVLSWTSLEIPQVPAWLPVGISFFTFQAQSYTIDVYYKVIPAEKSLLRFSLFVSFFPQLVAGPIVKARHFLPQLQRIPKVQWEDVSFALFSISTGLMLKMVVADNLAQYTIALKAPLYEVRHSLNLLVLSWAFMVQIFGDFAGYSAIAIGLARLFGYRLPINFNAPFIALGFNDFWKRWHITLTNWFKDYLFLRMAMRGPLKGKMYHGLGLTFLASGLWHGAHWTYVIWGALQGLGCIVDMAYHRSHGPRWAPSGWRAFLIWALTFQCICWLGVVFFHHEMDPVLGYFSFLFGEGWQQPLLLPRVADMIFFMMPVLVIHLYVLLEERTRKQKKCSFLLDLREKSSFQMVMTGLNLCLLSLMWGEKQGFIYFAF